MKFKENNDIRCMYKQWFKNKVKHKQRAHYISVDLRISRYHFCIEKSITITCKIYLRLFFLHLCRLPVTHNIFCILQHDWRCNMDYSPFSSAFKMKTKNIRITYKYMKYKFKKRLICEFVAYMYKKKIIIINLKATDISAVQMLKCIGSFY